MANTKISELPLFTGNTSGSYLVMNNSGQTQTFKVLRESVIGASGTSGTSGTSGSSGGAGASGSSGSSGTSGSNGSSGDSIFAQTGSYWNTTRDVGITGSVRINTATGELGVRGTTTFTNGNSAISIVSGAIFEGNVTDLSIGLLGNGKNLILNTDIFGTTQTGSVIIKNNTVITGSLILSGSAGIELDVKGDQTLTGSLAVSGSITTTANSTFNGVNVGRGGNTGSFGSTRVGANSLSYSGVGATGGNNTAIGVSNLTFNSVGGNNTAVGVGDLSSNRSGSFNTAIGASNLANLLTGNENTAIGYGNLNGMYTGSSTIAIGTSILGSYNGGDFNNMGIGPRFTLQRLISGGENIAIGSYAMQNVYTGSNNTVIGGGALANFTGSNNIALGYYAGTSLTGTINNTLIIDSIYRTNYPNEGLIYGTMNSTVANQTLKINAKTSITNDLNVTGSVKITEALNLKPLYIGTGSIYTGSLSSVPGAYGDVRVMYSDDNYRGIYLFGGYPPGDWISLT